jgi:hypothetical protein
MLGFVVLSHQTLLRTLRTLQLLCGAVSVAARTRLAVTDVTPTALPPPSSSPRRVQAYPAAGIVVGARFGEFCWTLHLHELLWLLGCDICERDRSCAHICAAVADGPFSGAPQVARQTFMGMRCWGRPSGVLLLLRTFL